MPFERQTSGGWAGPGRGRPPDADQQLTPQREYYPPRAQASALASESAAAVLPTPSESADTPVDGDVTPSASMSDVPERAGRGNQQEREPLRPEVRADVGPLIDSLRGIFERDRAMASQGDSARCGICYLHFTRAELVYREAEGFYVCSDCMRSLGPAQVFMVRRQQK